MQYFACIGAKYVDFDPGSNPTCRHLLRLIKHYVLRCRPYYHENTGSRPISEVKRGKARLVLGSVTAWEPLRVLTAFSFPPSSVIIDNSM